MVCILCGNTEHHWEDSLKREEFFMGMAVAYVNCNGGIDV